MFYLLGILWYLRTVKVFLFYFYLWQIKEYHIRRFLSHLKTDKGKKLLFNKLVSIKVLLLIPFLFFLLVENRALLYVALAAAFLIYFIEFLFIVKNILRKELKKPVLTKKTVVLVPTGFLIGLLIVFGVYVGTSDIFSFGFGLLAIDIFIPLIASLVVLFFQPLTVLVRNQIIKKAANKISEMENLKVIGITGSYGKTSVKEFLSAILSDKFIVLKTENHQNSEMGISQCILRKLTSKHQVFVVEMGAYTRGGIKLLSDIVKPKIGILTGVNQQHLSLFGSLNNIVKTKYELIENLSSNGIAIFNGDNEYCLNLYKKTNISKKIFRSKKEFLGVKLEADIWAENIKVEKEGISFKVFTKDKKSADFKVNVLGIQNVSNILAAVLTAKELGMNLGEISKACIKIKPGQGSMKIIKGKNDPCVIDASYSANPDGVIADLDYLKTWQNKKAIIMPCLIELGSASAKVHQRIGRKIGSICDLAIITTSDYFNEIRKTAIASGMKKENILYIENSEEIINQINIFSNPGDAVLLEGRVPEKVIDLLTK